MSRHHIWSQFSPMLSLVAINISALAFINCQWMYNLWPWLPQHWEVGILKSVKDFRIKLYQEKYPNETWTYEGEHWIRRSFSAPGNLRSTNGDPWLGVRKWHHSQNSRTLRHVHNSPSHHTHPALAASYPIGCSCYGLGPLPQINRHFIDSLSTMNMGRAFCGITLF